MRRTVLFVSLLSTATFPQFARADLCQDVRDSMQKGQLAIAFDTTEPWYVPGELVQFRLTFRNLSSQPLLIPTRQSLERSDIEFLSGVKVPDRDEIIWESVTTRVAVPLSYQPCAVTQFPQVILPGATTQVLLTDMSEWRSGAGAYHLAGFAPSRPGKSRVRFTLGTYSKDSDIAVMKVESFDVRCLTAKTVIPETVTCREIAIVRTDKSSVVLLAGHPSPALSSVALAGVIDDLDRDARRGRLHILGAERILLQPGKLNFLSEPGRMIPSPDTLVLLLDDKTQQRVDLRRFPARLIGVDKR